MAALRARHARKQSLAYIATPSGLVQAAASRFGSYRAAIKAAGFDYDSIRRYRAWDRQSIVAELRQMHAAGVKPSSVAIKKRSMRLYGAIQSHFGSFADAMAAAGIEYHPLRRWGKLVVFDQLRSLHRRGEDLSAKALRERVPGLYDAARSAFGSYRRAIEWLGVDYRRISRRATWNKAAVIAEFRRLKAAGVQPRVSSFIKEAPRLVGAATAQFGTFVKAIKAADIGYQPRHIWTRREILDRLLTLHRAGEDLWVAAIKQRHGGLYAAALRQFGSYAGQGANRP